MAQSIKCFLCKPADLSSHPSAHRKSQEMTVNQDSEADALRAHRSVRLELIGELQLQLDT